MREIPGGRIYLRDEGTGRGWQVDVAPFLLAEVPVTRGELHAVLGGAPNEESEARLPATDVSWFDAIRFCAELSRREGRTPAMILGDDDDGLDATFASRADGYRLPTEAEWEYACRAGSNDVRPGPLDEIAWHRGNSGEVLHQVGTRSPNAWGLQDMIGNVWEWCWDLFDTEVYGPYRVFRGGGFADLPRSCRASCRRKSHPTFRIDDLGFRLARS